MVEAICDLRDHEIRFGQGLEKTAELRDRNSAIFLVRFELQDAIVKIRRIERGIGGNEARLSGALARAARSARHQGAVIRQPAIAESGARKLIAIIDQLLADTEREAGADDSV
ncbi:hypothetical protein [Paracoccus marinaquae]|uniref:Uncharacterized protein n=1 Tax=Paracoccus marinaquae TaxID=2841926 RepID=A0ABS6AHB3_9RHOB|nr:hypothetical protein [Paracoccus marinaquae]MBU3029019.1 hypothetical protein [Paracoccus marinaquae]